MHVQNSLGVIPADGDFGSITDGAVKGFQAAAGLLGRWHRRAEDVGCTRRVSTRARRSAARLPQEQIDQIVRHRRRLGDCALLLERSWRGTEGLHGGDRVVLRAGGDSGLQDVDPTALTLAQADRNDRRRRCADVVSRGIIRNARHRQLRRWHRHAAQSVRDVARARHARVVRSLLRRPRYFGDERQRRHGGSRDAPDQLEHPLVQRSDTVAAQSVLGQPERLPSDVPQRRVAQGDELANFGSGDGAKHQFLSKFAPAYHAYVTAIGMRFRSPALGADQPVGS